MRFFLTNENIDAKTDDSLEWDSIVKSEILTGIS